MLRIRLLNAYKRPGSLTGQWPWLNVFLLSLWCALVIRGAVHMPGVLRGHQRAAVHYKGAWLELRLHKASFQPETSWRKEGDLCFSLSFLGVYFVRVLAQMETKVLTVLCTFLLCSSGVVFSVQEHAGLEASLAFRNLTMNHRSRYPLYMMQLYRSFTAAEFSSVAVNTVTTHGGNPSAHHSDSVLSLMARGEETVCILHHWIQSMLYDVYVSFISVVSVLQQLLSWCIICVIRPSLFTTQQVSKCLFDFKGSLCFMWVGVYISPQTSLHRGVQYTSCPVHLPLQCFDICPGIWFALKHPDCWLLSVNLTSHLNVLSYF